MSSWREINPHAKHRTRVRVEVLEEPLLLVYLGIGDLDSVEFYLQFSELVRGNDIRDSL